MARRNRPIKMPAPYLRRVWLDPARIPNRKAYPFVLPLLGDDFELGFDKAITIIVGENGTGKGVIARQIHRLSRRAEQPLIKVNMGGIAESVFESEMFGHVKGAYTGVASDRRGKFELADGGTLFLDEVGELPLATDRKSVV